MSIESLQANIAEWADQQFPERDIRELLTKLKEEIEELEKSGLCDPLEYADVLILVLDMAYLQGIDAETAVVRKMAINRNRRWKKLSNGTHQHVKAENNGQ